MTLDPDRLQPVPQPPPEVPLIRLSEVSLQRGSTRILDRISIEIPQARHTAVLGPNGAGKTSLLRLLTRQYYPSIDHGGHQGQVEILGREVWEVAQLRRAMGVVSSTLDFHFSAGRTGRMRVEQAVASGITATELAEFGVELTPAVMQRVKQCLELLQAEHLLGRSTETLSTGERRRVLIARALVNHPRILVLDEPTTGLDLGARHQFLGTLGRLCTREGMTVVLVTHHVEEIVPELQHVVLLSQGRVCFDGPASEGLTADRIGDLFGVPVQATRREDGTLKVHAL